MAQSNLEIKIKALIEGLEEVRQLTAANREVGDAVEAASKQAQEAAEGNKKLTDSQHGAGAATGKLGEQFAALKKEAEFMTSAVKGAVTGFVGMLALDNLKDLIHAAEQVEALGLSLTVVGNNAGYTKEQIGTLTEAVKELGIGEAATLEGLTKLVKANVDLTTTSKEGLTAAQALAKGARDIAILTGQEEDKIFTQIAGAIERGNVMQLKRMGIQVDINKATDLYLQSLGEANRSLDDGEKKTAIMNEAIRQMAKYQGLAAEGAETIRGKTLEMKSLAEASAVAVGQKLAPAWKGVLDGVIDLQKHIGETVENTDKGGQLAATFGAAIKDAALALSTYMKGTVDMFAGAFKYIAMAGTELVKLVADVFKLGTGVRDVSVATELLKAAFFGIGLVIAGLRDGIQFMKAVWYDFVAVARSAIAVMLDGLAKVIPSAFEVKKTLTDMADSFRLSAEESHESSNKIIQDFADGKSAVAQFIEEAKKTGPAIAEGQQGASEKFKELEEKVLKLQRAFASNKIGAEELHDSLGKLRQEVEAGVESQQLSSEEAEKMGAHFETIADLIDSKTLDAFRRLKLTREDLNDGFKKATQDEIIALEQLGNSAKLTAAEIQKMFDIKLTSSKSIEELTAKFEVMKKSILNTAEEQGRFTEEVEKARIKFGQLFEAQLKSAKTKKDFEELKKVVEEAGQSGLINGEGMAAAYAKVAEAVNHTTRNLTEMAKQQRESADSMLAVAKANASEDKARIAVQTEMVKLAAAEKKAREEGTDAAKADVEIAKASVALAQQRAQVEHARAQETSANADLIARKQEAAAAAQAAADDQSNLALQGRAEAAKQAVAQAELNLAAAHANTAEFEAGAAQLEVGVENAKRLKEELVGAGEAAQGMQGDFGKAANAFGFNQEQLMTWFTAAGVASKDAFAVSKAAADDWAQYVALKSREVAIHTVNDWIDFVNQGFAVIEQVKEIARQMGEDKRAAEEWADSMRDIRDYAERTAEAMVDGVEAMQFSVTGSEAWADAMYQVWKSAQGAAKAATEAAKGFLDSVGGIHEELLRAQGKEEEATKLAYEGRKKNLAIEERLLEIKIQAAIIEAKAAGMNKAAEDLADYLKQVKAGYQDALRDLDELERIELEKFKKVQEEAKNSGKTQKDTNAATHTEKMGQYDAELARLREQEAATQRILGTAIQASGVLNGGAAFGSAVGPNGVGFTPGAGGGGAGMQSGLFSGGPQTSGKVIEVNFTANGKSVTGTIAEGDYDKFMELMKEAQGTAA